MNVRERLSRNVSMDRPFGVSFDGGRKRAHRPPVRALTFTKRRPPEQQMHAAEAEQQRIAAMTPEQYARHVGLSEDQVARVRRIAELRGEAASQGHAASA